MNENKTQRVKEIIKARGGAYVTNCFGEFWKISKVVSSNDNIIWLENPHDGFPRGFDADELSLTPEIR